MRYDGASESLRFDSGSSDKSAIMRASNLAYARFETTISHRVEGLLALIFESPEGMAIVPWIALDGVMLMEREVSPLVWPSWMRWLDPQECDAIEARVEPWLFSRVLARLENDSGDRFFEASQALRERVSYARGAGWIGAASSNDVLSSIAPHRYAWRFSRGANALVKGAGAANGGALLSRRASSTTIVLEDTDAVNNARVWFDRDCFTAKTPAQRWDVYIGPRDPGVDAATRIYLGGDATADELRVPIAKPLPLGIMVSFDLDDAPEIGAISVSTRAQLGRSSTIVEPQSVGGSTGRVALVVREDARAGADADTDAAEMLQAGLTREGFSPSIVTPSHFDGSAYDLVHVFGYRYAGTIIEQLEVARSRGVPIILTPYADDARDESRTQSNNVMSALAGSFDETVRGEYLTALAHRKLISSDQVPDLDLVPVLRLFELAGAACVTSAREEERIRAAFAYSGAVARVPAYAQRIAESIDVSAFVGGDDYVLVRGPLDWRSNQYLIARAAASVGLPLVVCGTVADALCYLKTCEALGELGMWLPSAGLRAEQERALVSRARVVADVSWSGAGLHRLATAAATRCALVASTNGYARDVWGDAVAMADPASVESIAGALRLAWDQSTERGLALAGITAAVCDPFAALVATVGGYQAAAASLVRS
jgi:hypothetical protein